jgi:protein-S-isoprenylcysteine O-methyltransferase Ste14
LFLLGVALLGRSGLALVLVLLFGIVFHIYLVAVEEPYLKQMFGESYRRYRLNTPRYAG